MRTRCILTLFAITLRDSSISVTDDSKTTIREVNERSSVGREAVNRTALRAYQHASAVPPTHKIATKANEIVIHMLIPCGSLWITSTIVKFFLSIAALQLERACTEALTLFSIPPGVAARPPEHGLARATDRASEYLRQLYCDALRASPEVYAKENGPEWGRSPRLIW